MQTCFYFLFFFCLSFFVRIDSVEISLPHVLVSVAPHKFFVEKIGGDTLEVNLIVPAGASAHTYEPTTKQMLSASRASLWFRIGEPFENRVIQTLASHNPHLRVIDLRQNLDLIIPTCGQGCSCHKNSADLHFWLSARLAQIQATTIAEALIEAYPQNSTLYQTNLLKFQNELKQLDVKIIHILKTAENRNILVSHPAYAYFCRDYGLHQYSIEFEGKDPTAQQLNSVLALARKNNIKTIFIQKQYSNKGARLIAQEIEARLITLDPYSEQYLDTMQSIAQAFAEG